MISTLHDVGEVVEKPWLDLFHFVEDAIVRGKEICALALIGDVLLKPQVVRDFRDLIGHGSRREEDALVNRPPVKPLDTALADAARVKADSQPSQISATAMNSAANLFNPKNPLFWT